ncbi:MAG: PEP-CTERM sorting domain-containing protein [Comamonadaceae bacterium]|nr:PEP-CTERM sorting domain-containing protein [Comamonadaceae bacterium]
MQTKVTDLVLAATLVAFTFPAHAISVDELEPNDTVSTSQRLFTSGSPITVNGERTFSDPSDDFFSFRAASDTLIEISAWLTSDDLIANAESAFGLFGPADELVASAFGSTNVAGGSLGTISFMAGAGGLYKIGFSGFNPGLISCGGAVTACYDTDDDFIPDSFVAGGGVGGSAGWNYAINVTAVPEPSTLAMLLAGVAIVAGAARPGRRTANRI